MTDLMPCGWREVRADETLLCRSAKYIAAPNSVNSDFCRTCAYADDGFDHWLGLPRADSALFTVDPPDAPLADQSGIAIATMYTPEIAEMGQMAAGAVRSYAKRHGYTAIVASDSLDRSRRPHWSKLVLIAHYLKTHPACHWLMWIDADAVITKPERSLQTFLDDDVDFLVGDDIPPSPINSGVFFMRNSLAVMDLIRRAYAKVHLRNPHWGEQAALAAAMKESPPSLRTRIVPQRLFNSFAGSYDEQDFVIHFAGCSYERKLAGVRQAVRAAYSGEQRRHPEPDVPVHSYRADYERLLRAVRPRRVVEWGPGLNTVLALTVGAETFSIEHQAVYLPKNSNPKLTMLFTPKESNAYCFFPEDADLYFIDGRNRARCLEAVYERCRRDAVVCLHDSQRQAYRTALRRFPFVLEPSLGFAVATKAKSMSKRLAEIFAKS